MLPSMPLIMVQPNNNVTEMREEDATPSSTTSNETCVTSSDMSHNSRSPRCSPDSVLAVKKASPLKHVTPILRKYSVHRKAKADKKAGLSCVSPRQHADVSPTCGQEAEEEDAPDIPEFDPPSSPLENKDNEEELAALMRASSTITRKALGPPTKKSRHAKDLELTLVLLQPEDASSKEQREHHMALTYLTKVQEELSDEQFNVFMQVLTSAEPNEPGGVAKLYEQVCSALTSHPQLAEEFLLFLEPSQALECGAFMQHQALSHVTDFVCKLQTYFTRQPHVVRMVLASLVSLVEQPGVTEDDVMATVLPLLKGSSLLTDCFLRLLPSARPPESLMTDFEEVVCEEMDGLDDEDVETLHVPLHEVKDVYGGDTCVCTCHEDTSDEKYKSRVEHCVPCGLKFIHGKMFLQSGRTLRPAKVTFLNEDMASAVKRLTPQTCVRARRRRNGNSFSLDDMDLEYVDNLSSPKSRRSSKSKLKCIKTHLLSPNGSSSSDTNPECRKTSNMQEALSPCGDNPSQRLSLCDNEEHAMCDENALSPCNHDDHNMLSPCNDMEEALSPCDNGDMEALSPCDNGDMEALSPCDNGDMSPCNDMDAQSPCYNGDENLSCGELEALSPAEPDSTVDEELEEELLEEEEIEEEEEEEEEEFFDDVLDESSQEEHDPVSTSDEGPRSSTPKCNGASSPSSNDAAPLTILCNGVSSQHSCSNGVLSQSSDCNIISSQNSTLNGVSSQSSDCIVISSQNATLSGVLSQSGVCNVISSQNSAPIGVLSQSVVCNVISSQNSATNGVLSQSNKETVSLVINCNGAASQSLLSIDVTSQNDVNQTSCGIASYSPPSSSTALSNVTSNSAALQHLSNLASTNKDWNSPTTSNIAAADKEWNSATTSNIAVTDKVWNSATTSDMGSDKDWSCGSPDKDPCWTRDEDKAILQAFQQGGTSQRMLMTVRQLLPERTPEQIMSRFHILLKLLQQMSSAARDRK